MVSAEIDSVGLQVYGGNKKSDNKSTRGQDWQGGQDKIWAALQRKEEENAVLHQTIKEYERWHLKTMFINSEHKPM